MNDFNPFEFEGRLGRLQYFGFGVIWAIILFVVAFAIGAGAGPDQEVGAGGSLALLGLMLLFYLATISYGIRRLHDFDKSGLWYLLTFVPFVNLVMGLILLLAPGTPGANAYGTR